MRLVFLGDQGIDFIPMVEIVAQCVNDLCFGQPESGGNLGRVFELLMERRNVADADAQAVDDRLAAA